MNRKQTFGQWGEVLATDFLQQKGYQILDHNVRTPYGEIDIIAVQGDALVFVEVKTRSTEAFGLPEESITKAKQEHLLNSVAAYLQDRPLCEADWRIDVIAIQHLRSGKPRIVHFENAINGR